MAWDANAKLKCLPECSPLSQGTGRQFTSAANLTQKAEVDEQRSQSASVGALGPARRKPEASPFTFTSSPWTAQLFEKHTYGFGGDSPNKYLPSSDAQGLVFAARVARRDSAEGQNSLGRTCRMTLHSSSSSAPPESLRNRLSCPAPNTPAP